MLLRTKKTLLFQLAGVVLHPVQIVMSVMFGKPCVSAVCRLKGNR